MAVLIRFMLAVCFSLMCLENQAQTNVSEKDFAVYQFI